MMIMVFYIDDWNKKHMAFVKTMDEVDYLKWRYDVVSFEFIKKG